MKIVVIGAGGWGTANALVLDSYGHSVTVWCRRQEAADEINRTHENQHYLSDVIIPDRINFTADRNVVKDADVVVWAIPSAHLRTVCASFVGFMPANVTHVSLVKGIEAKTHKRMSEVIAETLHIDNTVVVLSGPSHAEEVARHIPTALVAASKNAKEARMVQALWSGSTLRVYTSGDPIGVEVAGAVKNVLAIAAGCSDGLGFGDNTRAALVTRGLAEMSRLALACGAQINTISGLAGLGDLVVTCNSKHSRNHRVGERLGKGESLETILASMQMVAEGIGNAASIKALAEIHDVEMPIANLVEQVCYHHYSVRDAITALMNRTMKDE